jgi:stage V sporulation protein S
MTTLNDSERGKVDPLPVSSTSHPYPVAEEIARNIRKNGIAVLQAVGSAAVTQAIKAVSMAYGYLLSDGIEIKWKSELADIINRGYKSTVTRFIIEQRQVLTPR